MRLIDWLTTNEISHAEMARRVGGVTSEAVRLWAGGRRMPDTKHILRIAEVTDGAVTVTDMHAARAENLTNGE
jgi:DNA-binding transcriptional regulator YdaS (Cro superfamily)